jgi:enterochelin esterase family protein
MPRYVQSIAARFTPGIRRGKIDTLRVKSAQLGHSVPVYVYIPSGRGTRLPVLFVTDGGDYLTLGRLDVILDNLIASKKIAPLLAVFIDPRTPTPSGEPKDYRMTEYAPNDAYLNFLESELAPVIERRFGASDLAEQRVILGASLGGIEATYAVLKRPNFINNCAAQSPAYFYRDSAVVGLSASRSAQGRYVYICAGTIGDTETEATLVAGQLRKHGAQVTLEVNHEGHNWTSWRARLPKILLTFFPRK